ncbi:hypothetical protein BJV77DRAFT_688937 [Russula vinacea]|nr:hypothetical protein BJV77DRAFT_688937 [Russula vinacea]
MSSHQHSRKRRASRLRLLSPLLPNRIARRIFADIPCDTPPQAQAQVPRISIDGTPAIHHLDTSNGSITDVHHVTSCDKAINILPDDILLLIFRFDRAICLDGLGEVGQLGHMPNWRWHRLVHVCQRWRSVVFGSPNFLDLRLDCGPTTRVELIGIWPPFPIVMRTWDLWPMPKDYDFDGALVHLTAYARFISAI